MTALPSVRVFLTASGARAANAGLAVVRAKIVALLLGPEGVGLLGLFTAAQEIGAQAADSGLSHSAVREVARTRDKTARAARTRRALALAVVVLATTGGAATWIFRELLSRLLTGSDAHADAFGVLALGLFLTVLFRWRQAVLAGLGRIGALSAGLVAGTGLSTLLALIFVGTMGFDGLVWAAVAAPGAGLLALLMVRAPCPAHGHIGVKACLSEWSTLVRLGVSLMLIAQMALIAPMLIRVWLAHGSGLAEAGLFQAAWTVSAQALTVLLTAVAMDFYPRLSAIGGDRNAMSACLAEQVRLHLAIGGPILLAIAGLAPFALSFLYAPEFAVAASLLQGLMVGGLARLVSAPIETVLTVQGQPRTVVLASLGSLAVLLAGGWLAFPQFGLTGIGIAFAGASVLHLAVLAALAHIRTAIAPEPSALAWLAGLTAAAIALANAPPIVTGPVALAALLLPIARRYRFFGTTSSGGRRSAAALNRLKVWLT